MEDQSCKPRVPNVEIGCRHRAEPQCCRRRLWRQLGPVSPSVFERGGAAASGSHDIVRIPGQCGLSDHPWTHEPARAWRTLLLHGPDRSRMVVLYAAPVSNPHGVQPSERFPQFRPPADRPATFTLWRFENGQFVGTLLAIRPDLYAG